MSDGTLPNVGEVTTKEIEGIKIRYARGGAKKGIPVLLTAPWPESFYSFHRLLPLLGEKHSYIAVDLPGNGLSDSRPDVMRPEAMGDFVVALIKHFGLNRVHVVAPDVGTLAFLFAAVKRPDLFESLIIGGGAMAPDMAAGVLKDLINSPVGAFAQVDGAVGVKDYLDHAAQLTPKPIIDDFRAASAGRRFEDAVQYVRGYHTDLPKLTPRLTSIKTPTLVIAGKDDPIVPAANGELLANKLPHNRYVPLDAGHRAWEESADVYNKEILAWLDGGYHSVEKAA
jgi:pimeloyl-ACP methyl ester carboxylesterase